MRYLQGIAVDPSTGDLYISEDNLIRMVTKSTSIITTVAGKSLTDVAIDPFTGDLYIADTRNYIVRLVTKSTGLISTIAGTGIFGHSGDGGLATNATLYPTRLAVDPRTRDLYITDSRNHVIRMIAKSTGIITTIAGTSRSGYSGNGGPATSAKLNRPSDVAIDAVTGNIYICDRGNNVIRMIAKSTGIITTVVGTRRRGYTGDGGPATLAMLSNPYSVVIDASSGMMYITDTDNNVIRSVILTLDVTSRPSVIPVSRPPTAVTRIPTAAPTSAGEDRIQ